MNTLEQDLRQYIKIYAEAQEAGRKAANDCSPAVMVVEEHSDPLDDSSPVVKSYTVPQGMCGFAWVRVRPANCRFANWLKALDLARTDTYAGGVVIWISDHGQSYERKRAHAKEMAKVLREKLGVKASHEARLD